MLDTNIFLDFVLIQWKEYEKQNIQDSLRRSKELKDRYLEKRFDSYISEWNLFEFRDVIEKIIEEKKLIQNGYSIHEFSEGRRELPLTQEENDSINKLVDDVYKNSELKTADLNPKKLERICRIGVSTFDALHLTQANSMDGCKYFITRDNRLIDVFKKKLAGELPNINVINRKEALAIL